MTTDPMADPTTAHCDPPGCLSRRALAKTLLAAGGLTLLPGALTACSSADSGDTASTAAAAVKGATVPAAEIPPVGTVALVTAAGAPVVLAQPTEGQYVAFSAICTHQGATVTPAGKLIVRCPAHGSEFNLGKQGEAVHGPATTPLPTIAVTRNGDDLVLG